jgi:Haem-binding domain
MVMANKRIVIIQKILIVLLVIFIGIQFIRPARNNGVAETVTDITHYVKVPDTVINILKTSCYDCHSNHTVYPWYVNINPVGLWMKNHIDDGKQAINFSDLSGFSKKKLDHRMKDIANQVDSNEMPLTSYTFIHRYAKLDTIQIQMIKNWTIAARKEIGYQP